MCTLGEPRHYSAGLSLSSIQVANFAVNPPSRALLHRTAATNLTGLWLLGEGAATHFLSETNCPNCDIEYYSLSTQTPNSFDTNPMGRLANYGSKLPIVGT
jgi:hypothetical protein